MIFYIHQSIVSRVNGLFAVIADMEQKAVGRFQTGDRGTYSMNKNSRYEKIVTKWLPAGHIGLYRKRIDMQTMDTSFVHGD